MNALDQARIVREYLDSIDGDCAHCETKMTFTGVFEMTDVEGNAQKYVQVTCASCGHVHFFVYEHIFPDENVIPFHHGF